MANDASRQSLGRLLVERGVITIKQLEAALAIQRSEGGLLGEILMSRGLVTPLSIAAALAKQTVEADDAPAKTRGGSGTWKPLGTVLLEKGLITNVELKQALAAQTERGGFIGEILVERGWLSAADLVLGLAAQLGLDFDVKRAAQPQGSAAIVPTDRPDAHFEVLEDAGGEVRLLKTTATFMEATDFVFDDVLWQREPGNLQIVRVDSGRREVAWSFRPGETQAPRDDMLSVFGYSVGSWEDKYTRKGGGPSVAAAG